CCTFNVDASRPPNRDGPLRSSELSDLCSTSPEGSVLVLGTGLTSVGESVLRRWCMQF
ncbi:hypothetical protein NDU88_005570, partial [Pleurodeles waltl]